uniref:Uncharacterized protein n=1 Tax=Cucumis melo TaxID=3656 RepID=A0A9I9DAA0_CUCME
MPRPRHQRQLSQVLPPDFISGEDPSQILDFSIGVPGAVSGQPHQPSAATANAAATAATVTVLQRSKNPAGQEGSGAGHFSQLPKTAPST